MMTRETSRKYKGRTRTLQQWADEFGLPYKVLYARLWHGCTFDEALHGPFKPRRANVEIGGETVNVRRLAEDAGIPYLTVWKRIVKLGWPVEDAVGTPVRRWRRTSGAVSSPPAGERQE